MERETLDVISVALNGNDIHFIRFLLEAGVRPKLFRAQYNGTFPPAVEFEIAYNPSHIWQGDDTFGASLASLGKLLNACIYPLVYCNSHTGFNAFFVDSVFADQFRDVPTGLKDLYVGPKYTLDTQDGHPAVI